MNPLTASASYLACCGLLFGALAEVRGAETTNTTAAAAVVLPAIVVTATRDERSAGDTPYSTGALDADALRIENAARTVPEALKNEPGTMIQKTGNAQGSPYIRGFTGYRNLLLIDGIRLNNSVFRDGPNQYWNTVDALGLRRIEVARGPYSMLYGSDAIGGTVNAITRGAEDLRPGSDFDRRVYYRYGSAENSHAARLETIGRVSDSAVLSLGASPKVFGDLHGGKNVGTQEKTGYDELDWDAKLEWFLGPDAFLVLAHQRVDIDDAWRTHKTIYGIDWEGLSVEKELKRSLDQDRDLTYLQFHQTQIDSPVEEVHAGLSYQLQSEEQDRLRSGERHDQQGFDVGTVGTFLTLKSPSPIGTLIYGTEFYHDTVDSFNRTLKKDGSVKTSSIQGPVADDATYDTLGLFLQDDIPLTDRLSLLLGGRYEYAQADADAVQDPTTGERIAVSGDWDDVVGSARLLYALDESEAWHAFTGVAQGFRAPNLSDLTRFDSARTDEIETPAPDLDPEQYVSYEVGVKAAMSAFSGQVALFHTQIDGMIVRTPTGRIFDGDAEVTKKNAGDGHVQGIDLEARYRFWRNLSAFGTCSWIDGKVDTYATSDAVLSSEPIDRLMPPTERVGLRWDQKRKYWIEVACSAAAKADKLSTLDKADTSRIPPGGTPGYAVYDIRAGWNCTDDLVLSVALENLADKDYRIHGSGVNEPGRNLVVALECTF